MATRRERPTKGSQPRKEELLQVRIQATEKEAFEDAANLAGLALSAWVRERLRQVARRELLEAGQSVAFLHEEPQRDEHGES